MHAEDENFAIAFSKIYHKTCRRSQIVNTCRVTHREDIVVAALPEASLTILHDIVHIVHVGIALLENLILFLAYDIQAVESRCTSNQLPVAQLRHLSHSRMGAISKGIVHESIGGIIEAVDAFARTYPQLSILVAVQSGYHITVYRGRVVRMMDELRKAVAVELVQSKVCRYPDVSVLILADIVNQSARKTLRRHKLSCLSQTEDRNQQNREQQ